PVTRARAPRALAMVAEPGDAEALFDEALALHAQRPDVFETARTRLAYGAELRSARRAARARARRRARTGGAGGRVGGVGGPRPPRLGRPGRGRAGGDRGDRT